MAMHWTPAQAAAITDRGGTLLVSAAAGSGKTAVLVERAVGLICDERRPVAADRLLIVTFTRAAAEELRGRIAARLAQAAAARPDSAWLRRQRMLLGRADIGTVDAFCMQLLRQYFARLEIPPDFTLADDAMIWDLRADALAQAMEEAYADEDFCAFAGLYGRARSDGTAAGAVESLYDFLRTLPRPARALEKFCAAYESDAPLAETGWGQVLVDAALDAAGNARQLTAAARALAAAEPALANYLPALDSDAAFFAALEEDLRAGRWDAAAVRAGTYKPPAFKAVRGYQGTDMEAVKALRGDAKKVMEALQANFLICTGQEFSQDRAAITPLLRAAGRAALRFGELFYAAKLEEKALEYSDLEHLALRLLWDDGNGCKTPLARQVAARYDAVMVDEYQDTNAIQALLYRCLANDDESNLFFVGDVKQSIYRFRLADPAQFLEKRGSFAPYAPAGPRPAAIALGHNFRSSAGVIGAVNDVFTALMSRRVGGVDYDEGEQLVPGIPDGYDGGPMELLVADAAADGDAELVAAQVQRMVAQGFAVRNRDGGTRPCRWEDFCVLVRSRGRFIQYEAAFQRLGIPAAADAGDSPLTAAEVTPLVALLQVIDNPGQDVPMAAALLSPLLGYSPDDLVALRAGQKRAARAAKSRDGAPAASLYAALLASKRPRDRRTAALLGTLRALAGTMPADRLCEEIFARTHYFAAVGAMENGAARRQNLRAFVSWAAGAGRGGLSALLRAVDSAIASGAVLSAGAPHLPAGCVSIMTIHRSKGLEFPVVILADTSRRFNLRDVYGPVLFHPRLGVGMALRAGEGDLYTTAPHRAIRTAQKAEAVSEEMRILYVALTRARDKLVVSIPLRDAARTVAGLALGIAGAGGVSAYRLGQASSMAEWLLTAALVHPDGGPLRKLAGLETLPLQANPQGRLAVRLSGPQAESPQAEEALEPPPFVRTAAPDAALERALMEGFARRYPNAGLCGLPAKLAVSAIAHAAAAPVLARPAFLYKEKLTGAERGTAMHAVLQYADLEALAAGAGAEVERLVAEGYLDGDLAGQLDSDALAAFAASPLCGRMRAARPLLREYAFLTAVQAKYVQPEVDRAFQNQPVLVQGIADAVLVRGDGTAEIADYKTDRGVTPAALAARYAMQLQLYRAAVEKRLGVRVNRCTIYSFFLQREVDVPLCALEDEKTGKSQKDEKNT